MRRRSDDNGTSAVKDGREWLMLLLSVLLAFIIWMLHNLSQEYSVFLEYRVEADVSIEGRAQSSVSNDLLMVRGKAEGYYILSQRLGKKKVIAVDIPEEKIHVKDTLADLFEVRTEDVKGAIVEALGGYVDLEFIVTETMDFTLKKMLYKRVPVAVKNSVTYSGQYMPVGRMILKPDSIDLYGDVRLLSTIDSVWTENIYEKNVHAPLQGIVKIVPIRRISYSESMVYYTQNVERYIEETMQVPVEVKGLPEQSEMILLPPVLHLTYRRLFGGQKYEPDDFRFSISYEDFIRSIDSKVVPVLENKPEDVISYSISPRYVNGVFIENRK